MFDVSGTLVDADNTLISIDNKFVIPWLEKRGYRIDSNTMRALREKYPSKTFYINLLKEMKWKMKKTTFKEFVDLVYDLFFFNIKPFEGVVSTLNYLRKKGLKIIIISNSNRRYVDRVLEKIDFVFDEIISYDKTKTRKKELKPFEYAIERLFLKPEECLMIGDRLDEDAFSRKLGIKFVWFPQRRNLASDVEEYDFVVKEFREIKKLADSLLELK